MGTFSGKGLIPRREKPKMKLELVDGPALLDGAGAKSGRVHVNPTTTT